MDVTRKLTDWRESHRDMVAIPLLRIVLGVAILIKIYFYVVKGGLSMESIMMSSTGYMSTMFGHWIPVLEIAAGILISIGLLTRASAIFQIPLFIAAIFFSKHSGVLASFEQSQVILSAIILALSIFFAFFGAGTFSAIRALKKENKREEDHFWHRDDQK